MIPLTVLAAGVANLLHIACDLAGARAKAKATRIYQPNKRQFFLLIIPPFHRVRQTEQLGSDLRSDRSENHTPRPHALP